MKTLAFGLGLLLAASRLQAQANRESLRLGSLELVAQAVVAVRGIVVRTVVRATNVGRDTTELLAPGDCALGLRVYRERWGHDDPVWDGPKHRRGCLQMLRVFRLPPGQGIDFVQIDSVGSILAGGVRAGTYHFSALLKVGRGGQLEMQAGSGRLK